MPTYTVTLSQQDMATIITALHGRVLASETYAHRHQQRKQDELAASLRREAERLRVMVDRLSLHTI